MGTLGEISNGAMTSIRKESEEWSNLWDGFGDNDLSNLVKEGSLSLGAIPKDARSSIRFVTEKDEHSYFLPNSVSIAVGSVYPNLLKFDEQMNSIGGMSLQWSGEGYLSWMPFDEIVERLTKSEVINGAIQLCREAFPARKNDALSESLERLGDMFLNRESYVAGDWILTIIETG